MNRIAEEAKIDMALSARALDNTNATGEYFDMSKYRNSVWLLSGGAMAATKTTKIELFEAKNAAASGAQALVTALGTITAGTAVQEATAELSSVANTDVVIINGISFTKAASTSTANKEFANAAGLVLCVAAALPEVTASASGTLVTVKATDPGAVGITISKTEVAGQITLATVRAQAYVELDTSALTLSSGYTHVAAKVTTTATTTVAVTLLRYGSRFTPAQVVGASATV
jgi:hypothetical protein